MIREPLPSPRPAVSAQIRSLDSENLQASKLSTLQVAKRVTSQVHTRPAALNTIKGVT